MAAQSSKPKETRKPSLVKDGELRSFGRVAARMSPAELAELDELLAAYTLDESVFDSQRPIHLEIGAGNGAQIFERAKADPEGAYIACEVFKNGLLKLLRQIHKAQLTNIYVVAADARDVLENISEGRLREVRLLYPDPWHKRKHHKRRIVNEDFIASTAQPLAVGGRLLMVTDITSYAYWMLERMMGKVGRQYYTPQAISPEEWAQPPVGWLPTKYEQKARREGRKSWYFTFIRHNEDKGGAK